MAQHTPLSQFEIKKIIDINLFGFDISFTNSSLMMLISTLLIILSLFIATKNPKPIPTKLQLFVEGIYLMIKKMINDNIGHEGQKFMPMLFMLFLFVLFGNLLGMIPYSFTFTSQIVVTLFLAMMIFFSIIIVGLSKQGLGFFSIFNPKGVPIFLSPLIIVIELFAFLARPISLTLRLSANMLAGHVLLKVLAGFIVTLPLLFKVLPIPLIVILIGFEFFVAILQAYIFAILSCVYLSDAVKSH